MVVHAQCTTSQSTNETHGVWCHTFWDDHITIKEIFPGIIGRAVSIARRDEHGEFSEIVACGVHLLGRRCTFITALMI